MLKNKILSSFLLLSLLMFNGCNTTEDNIDDQSAKTEALDTAEVFSRFDVNNEEHQIILQGNHFTFKQLFHDSTRIYSNSYESNGSKVIQPNDTIVGRYNLLLLKQEISFSIQSEVDTANAEYRCGFDNWSLNTLKNITATDCDDSTPGKIIKTLWFTTDTELYLGDGSDVGEDGYPDSIQTDSFTRR